ANIESKEQRRLEYQARSLVPLNTHELLPQMIWKASLLHFTRCLVEHSIIKRLLRTTGRLSMQKFVKRINIDLPFHYWTGVNERFNVGPMKSFNEPPD
ncbi:Hypothetical predicted protein, partial [Paramuricea clavata]